MALNENSCPICKELAVNYQVGAIIDTTSMELDEDTCNRLRAGLPVIYSPEDCFIILIPYEKPLLPTSYSYVFYMEFGPIGSNNTGIKFGYCSFHGTVLDEFRESQVLDIY